MKVVQRWPKRVPRKKESPASEPKRILLVDDDAEIIEAMRYALEAKGYAILVARDGNQGLALAEREDPDLVILDMMMPKRSGFLVLEKLRRTRPVPMRIIMITANEGSRHKAYAEMLGVDDYIRKPFADGPAADECGPPVGLNGEAVRPNACLDGPGLSDGGATLRMAGRPRDPVHRAGRQVPLAQWVRRWTKAGDRPPMR